MSNPFLMPPRTVISFSGGRTSGVMLRKILDAHGGTLPADVVVIFCNTGKEREETLDFVQEVADRWGVPVVWLEYVATPSGKFRKKDGKELWRHTFKVADHATASRKGEPFENVILTRTFLPNSQMRFCTGELKIKTTNRYVRQFLGWNDYTNAIGFRSDEPTRVAKLVHHHRNAPVDVQLLLHDDWYDGEEEGADDWRRKVPGETPVCPLFDAGIDLAAVKAFWAAQPFDLRLLPHEGNCDLCFLKGANKILRLINDRPESADWWAEQETKIARAVPALGRDTGTFRADRPRYSELKLIATGREIPGDIPGLFAAPDLSEDGKGCALWDDCRCTD
jgi:3'-phosphoadenosine 5'-phosphosulfate sulfotransferase (PAPS reductase)/FAD synthetase